MELVRRGDVRRSSFAFRTFEDDWSATPEGFPCGLSCRAPWSTSPR